MISNSLLQQFVEEVDDEFTIRIIAIFDQAMGQDTIDPAQAILEEAIRALEERTNEISQH